MTLRFKLARMAPAALAMVGGSIGIGAVTLYPPQHPDDWLFALSIAGGGLATLGLLVGLLGSLWFRKRINFAMALSALAIPFTFFGWFLFGKGGNWDVAAWFAIAGGIAAVVFLVNSITRLTRDSNQTQGH